MCRLVCSDAMFRYVSAFGRERADFDAMKEQGSPGCARSGPTLRTDTSRLSRVSCPDPGSLVLANLYQSRSSSSLFPVPPPRAATSVPQLSSQWRCLSSGSPPRRLRLSPGGGLLARPFRSDGQSQQQPPTRPVRVPLFCLILFLAAGSSMQCRVYLSPNLFP